MLQKHKKTMAGLNMLLIDPFSYASAGFLDCTAYSMEPIK